MEVEEKVKFNLDGDFDQNDSGGGDDDWRKMKFCSKVKYVFQNITVEPLLGLFQMSSMLSSLTTQNLNLQKACRVNLQLDDKVCYGLENKNITQYADEEVMVQKLVADMLIWQTIIQSSIPCMLLVFIGSWSDRHRRRKPFMLVPVVGEILRNFGLLLCVFYFVELKMEVAGLVESIPTALAGGLPVLYMATFSYFVDISSIKHRTVRMGILNLFFGSAWPIGAALSGVSFQKFGFYGVYIISTSIYALVFLYGLCRIKEQHKTNKKNNVMQKPNYFMIAIIDFFSLKHVKKAFHVTFKKNSQKRWIRLYILIFIILAVNGPTEGEFAVSYLTTRVRFNWNEVDYSIFSTFLFLINIFGVLISTGVLSHLFKIDDALIGIIASLSKFLSSLIFAFAPSTTFFYVGAVFDIMNGVSHVIIRSILSKIVPPGELGQVSSVFAIIETIIPIVFKPMYSAIYTATVHKFPGAFYLVGSLLFIPSMFLYWWIYCINKQEEKEQSIVNDNDLNTNILYSHN